MRVLLVHNQYREAGGEDAVVQNERALLRRYGHTVATYQRSNGELDQRMFAGARLVSRGLWSKDAYTDVRELIEREEPDVAHVHNTFFMISPSVYQACYDAGVAVVQTLHNYRPFCPGANLYHGGHICEKCLDAGMWAAVRHGCYRDSVVSTAAVAAINTVAQWNGTWDRLVSIFIAPSDFTRRKFVEAGFPPDKVVVKPHFCPPVGKTHGQGTGDYALFLGRLSSEKGIRTALKAWSRLDHGIRLVVAGDGPLRAELEREARCRELNIVFLGRVPGEEVQPLLARARFLVYPSECYETFGMAIIEAFACGIPVLASAHGAMADLVRHRRTGLLFTPGSADELASAVTLAWNDSDSRARMAHAARREYEERYTPDANHRELLAIYQAAGGRPALRHAI